MLTLAEPSEHPLTVPEVAERLRANPQIVRRWLREGQLRGVMPGGEELGYRILESEVRRLLQGKWRPDLTSPPAPATDPGKDQPARRV